MPHFENAKYAFISGQTAVTAVDRPCLLLGVICTNHDTAGTSFTRLYDSPASAANQVLELAHTLGQENTVVFTPAVPLEMRNGVYVTCSSAQNYVTVIYA